MNDVGMNKLLVDNRAGSVDLADRLTPQKNVELTTLKYGDVAFLGNGPGGDDVFVGIEYKKLPDFVNSCCTGRLVGHQLPGMFAIYDICFLLLEGAYRINRKGEMLIPRGLRWCPMYIGGSTHCSYKFYQGHITTLLIRTPLRIVHTFNQTETAKHISLLYSWYNDKKFEEHKSHLSFHANQPDGTALLTKPSLARRIAKELPGVGWDRSKVIAREFKTVARMVGASKEDWMKLPGIGKTLAEKIYTTLHG